MTWFPVLLIAIAACCYAAAAVYLGRRHSWNGSLRTTTFAKNYYWKVAKNKGRAVGTWIGIEGGCAFDFKLEPEGRFHGLSESFGFCTKFETGDVEFDRKVFVMSDAEVFQRMLRSDADLHVLVLQVLSLGAGSIYSTPKMLTVKLQKATEYLPDQTIDAIVETLFKIKERLAKIAPVAEDLPATLRLWDSLFVALPPFMVAAAVAGWILTASQHSANLDSDRLFPMALKWGLGISVAMFLVIRAVFHRSSYGHFILRHFLVFGIGATFVMCLSLLNVYNSAYDSAPAKVYVQPVIRKYITHGSKGSVHYYVETLDWRHGGSLTTVTVDLPTYNDAHAGGYVRIGDHPGRLGMEWIDRVEIGDR